MAPSSSAALAAIAIRPCEATRSATPSGSGVALSFSAMGGEQGVPVEAAHVSLP